MTFANRFAHESQHTDVSGLRLCVMSSGSLREAPRRFKVMAAETERFSHPVDIRIHKHELRLPTHAINSTGKGCVSYVFPQTRTRRNELTNLC